MKFRFTGLKEYVQKLEKLSNPAVAEAMVVRAVAEGSRIVDSATRKELQSMPVDNRPYVYGDLEYGDGVYRYVEGKRTGILQVQKDALIASFGTSPIETRNGFTNDKTGVDNSRNKLGQKQVTVARRLENGTSYMKKNPVFSRASRKARKDCLEEMQKSLDESIKALTR